MTEHNQAPSASDRTISPSTAIWIPASGNLSWAPPSSTVRGEELPQTLVAAPQSGQLHVPALPSYRIPSSCRVLVSVRPSVSARGVLETWRQA